MIEKLSKVLLELINSEINTQNLSKKQILEKIENVCVDKIFDLQKDNIIINKAKSKRTIEDVQINYGKLTYKVDVKTHGANNELSMPNLISIDRLRKFYESDDNFLIYVFINYSTENNITKINKIDVKYIEEIHWSMLAIQNIGKGQLQIKDMKNDLLFTEADREKWMTTLRLKAVKYYDKLIEKVESYQKDWA